MTPTTITSTAHLTPDGVLGYAKFIATFISAILIGVADTLPESWRSWVQIAIALCGAIATFQVPNKVKPVTVVPADTGD